MIIEIKNVQYSKFASEDSHCFTATVYIDGHRLCTAFDNGQGGGIHFRTIKKTERQDDLYKQIAKIESDLPPIELSLGDSVQVTKNSLEMIVNELVNEWLTDKEIKKMLKKDILFSDGKDLRRVMAEPNAENYDRVRKQSWWQNEYVILNELPYADARALFFEITEGKAS